MKPNFLKNNNNLLYKIILFINMYLGTINIIYSQNNTNYFMESNNTYLFSKNTLPVVNIFASGSTTFCEGNSVLLYTNTTNSFLYQWLKNNTVITNATNSSYTVYQSGYYALQISDSIGNTETSDSIVVTVNPLPVAAGTISGLSAVCQNQTSVTYNVPIIINATSYIWTLPNGATGTSNTNLIIVDFSDSATTGNITVKGNNSCGYGNSSEKNIIVNPLPDAAGTISGLTSVCRGQDSVIYTVQQIPNATSYIWSFPSGAFGMSSTNSIIVNFSNNALSGDITVQGINDCGAGSSSSLAVSVGLFPAPAGIITGLNSVCQGQNSVTYTVPSIPDATSYIWTLPNGVTGTSSTNTIVVNYSNTAISGNIKVCGHNNCGNGNLSSLQVTVYSIPVNTGIITGFNTVCQDQKKVVYKIPHIESATSYIWTLLDGSSITTLTDTLVYNYSPNAVSGTLSVKGHNDCGESSSSSLYINVGITPVADFNYNSSSMDVVFNNLTQNANTYLWIFGDGSTSTLQTPIHKYSYNGLFNIKLIAYNGNCSDTSKQTLILNVGIDEIKNPKVNIYPNPNNGKFILDVKNINTNKIDIEITNDFGQNIYSDKFNNNITKELDFSAYNKGIYFVKIRTDKFVKVEKVVIQ